MTETQISHSPHYHLRVGIGYILLSWLCFTLSAPFIRHVNQKLCHDKYSLYARSRRFFICYSLDDQARQKVIVHKKLGIDSSSHGLCFGSLHVCLFINLIYQSDRYISVQQYRTFISSLCCLVMAPKAD